MTSDEALARLTSILRWTLPNEKEAVQWALDRIAALESDVARLTAERAELQADRERLGYVLDEMYVYHGKVIKTREAIDDARKAGA